MEKELNYKERNGKKSTVASWGILMSYSWHFISFVCFRFSSIYTFNIGKIELYKALYTLNFAYFCNISYKCAEPFTLCFAEITSYSLLCLCIWRVQRLYFVGLVNVIVRMHEYWFDDVIIFCSHSISSYILLKSELSTCDLWFLYLMILTSE